MAALREAAVMCLGKEIQRLLAAGQFTSQDQFVPEEQVQVDGGGHHRLLLRLLKHIEVWVLKQVPMGV